MSIGSSVHTLNYCTVVYAPSSNSLFLYDDLGTTELGPLTPGVPAVVSNSQCTLDGGSSSVTVNGNRLIVSAALTFASIDIGTPKTWLFASRNNGQNTGYVPFGSWTPNAASPFFPQSIPSTQGVTVVPVNEVSTPADISATDDPSVWVADIDGCPTEICFFLVQDPAMGSTILADWTSSAVVQQADISTGSGSPSSSGEWDLSQKSSLIHYLKNENATLVNPQTQASVLDHYVLVYDRNDCVREWFISGTQIPLGQWVQISVADIQNGPYYYQSCPLDFSHIVYFEVGLFGPNVPFKTEMLLQLASVGSE